LGEDMSGDVILGFEEKEEEEGGRVNHE